MLYLAVLLLAASVSGQLHSVCHTNVQGISEELVVNQIADTCDLDKDGTLIIAEVVIGFSRVLNMTLPLADSIILGMNEEALIGMADLFGVNIPRQDFIDAWYAHYHDNKAFIGATFDEFDDNRDGALTVRELEGILFHIRQVTGNLDGIITRQEFVDYFLWIYRNC